MSKVEHFGKKERKKERKKEGEMRLVCYYVPIDSLLLIIDYEGRFEVVGKTYLKHSPKAPLLELYYISAV